jgi:translocation and assembly module TamB
MRIVMLSLLSLLVLLLVLTGVLLSTAWWALRSERGTAWLLSQLPGVQVDSPKGALLGDFGARQLIVDLPGGKDRITLTDFGWRGLDLQRGSDPLWARVSLDSLFARRVDVLLAPAAPASGGSMSAPANLQLPIELELRSLKVGELHAAPLGERPLLDIDAALHIGAGTGEEHRIDRLTLTWDRLKIDVHASIASGAPMAIAATLALAQDSTQMLPAWGANATLAGPLAEPVLRATLRASAGPQHPAQTLDAQATLRPFAPWPLGELKASATALDLSAFASAAPVTALDLEASASSSAADQPATLIVDLQNAQAGRWSEARLPIHGLKLELAARPDRPSDLELRALTAMLGTPKDAAGRITAKGRWTPERWHLDASVQAVRPSRLDARAPAMELSGPVTANGGAAAERGVDLDIRAALSGSLVEGLPPRPVKIQVDAGLGTQRVALRELSASAGAARVSANGTATRAAADGTWGVKLQAMLADFDPGVWWPGDDNSPWRRADNQLNVRVEIDTTTPAPAAGRSGLETLAAMRGTLALSLDRSLFAGVALNGVATLRNGAGGRAAANAKLDVGGNTVRVDGQLATTGKGVDDAWDVAIDAKSLERLAPLLKLFQPTRAEPAITGTVRASAHATGRWPALTTRGDLEVTRLRVGTVAVQGAQARWTAGTAATDPIDVQATLTKLTMTQNGAPGPSIETGTLQLKGTARGHTLNLRAESRARPPAWAETVAAAATPDPAASAAPANANVTASVSGEATQAFTVAVLRARGGLVDVPGAAPAGWRGTLEQLELRTDDPRAAPLARTSGVSLEAFWAGGPPRATVQPGRIELLGGALQWSRIVWQAPGASGAPARIEVDALLEPMRVAPLLARAQPNFGWSGDLIIAGHIKVRSAPSFSADIVIERNAGDLAVTDELGSRVLGLTDLRLGLNADDGVWNFTTGVAGKVLGVTAGAFVVRTSPQLAWPTPDAPVQGVLEVKVADLGTLGTWMPPGWRVGGGLRASATFGGSFGAPEYTGKIEGTGLAARNFLLGINVTDGDVAIGLQGTQATIERFTAKGSSGSLRVDGSASFGEAPQARLELSLEKFQALGRVDRRIIVSGNGRLRMDNKSLAADGKFGVDEGLIDISQSDAPALADDVQVTRSADAAQPVTAATDAAPRRDVTLDLRVNLGEKLALRGRGLDARLGGELRITSPDGKVAVNGAIRVVSGTYQAYGQKLVIDRGQISFNGPIDRPRLDIQATRPNLEEIRVGVAITGSATNPRVRLFSEPELSEVDKLSWLVMGRASDNLGRTETALMQRAALALVSGEGPGLTDQLTQALGLDELSLSQREGDVTQTVLSVGKKLTDRWSIGYERGLNATAGSFQLIYRIAQRFTLRAQSGDDNSLDLIWSWRWN